MIRRCDDLPDGTVLNADVCVIGGGPAGLTVAAELAGTSLRVILIEAGGEPGRPLGLTESSVADRQGDLAPPLQIPPRLGGGANEWIVRLPKMQRGVRMLPLAPFDLETRSWVPNSGWPITWSELDRYYQRANEFLGLSSLGYTLEEWEDTQHPRLPLEAHGFTTTMEHFASPSVFTKSIRQTLADCANVDVYLDGAVGAIDGAADQATHVMVDHGTAGRVQVKANQFVLAAGGINNARLLLSARDHAGFAGSQVATGRYYVDHQRIGVGSLTPSDPGIFRTAGLYDLTTRASTSVMGKLTPTEALLTTHRILHSGSMLLPKPPAKIEQGLTDVRSLVSRSRQPGTPRPSIASLAQTALYIAKTGTQMAARQRRLPPRIDAGWSGLTKTSFGRFSVETQIELAPDRNNRVHLGNARDQFGRRRPEMFWRWHELDLHTVKTNTALLATAFQKSQLGRFEPEAWDARPLLTTPNGAFHPSGTTRMGDNASTSVTDCNAKLHSASNVYVAGSSLFPTVGYANPTLTIVALAIRLADHLRPSAIAVAATPVSG